MKRTITQIDFDIAITYYQRYRTGLSCIFKGKSIDNLKGSNPLISEIKKGETVDFYEVNTLIHKLYKEIDYIDFWFNCEIYTYKI